MAIQNKELKCELIESGEFDRFLKFRQLCYMIGEDPDDRSLYHDYTDDEFKALLQLKQQRYQKRSRINKWFDYWLTQPDKCLYFLTFTFSDDALMKKSSARKMSVYRQIEGFDDYICNIDFGEKSNREHYHAVVVADRISQELMNWKYSSFKHKYFDNETPLFNSYNEGYYNVQLVDPQDNAALKKYEAKLTSHALKTGSYKLGFKRKSKYQEYVKYMAHEKKMASYKYWKDHAPAR